MLGLTILGDKSFYLIYVMQTIIQSIRKVLLLAGNFFLYYVILGFDSQKCFYEDVQRMQSLKAKNCSFDCFK